MPKKLPDVPWNVENKIIKKRKEGWKYQAISDHFGVKISQVRKICHGVEKGTWTPSDEADRKALQAEAFHAQIL